MLLSAPFLGLIVAAASWDVLFLVPGYGLDPSWPAGISMGTERGMDFGTEIIHTWGPLGFLHHPKFYYDDLTVLGFLYQSLLHVALCVSLVWALGRSIPKLLAAVAVFYVIVELADVEVAQLLVLTWCLAALDEETPAPARGVVVVGGALLSAVEMLARIASGPVILGMCLVTLAAGGTRRRDLPAFLALFAGSFAVLWAATGQGLGNLDDFVRNSVQITSGHVEAMDLEQDGLAWQYPAAALVAGVLVAAAWATQRSRAARIGGALVVAGLLFATFKDGFVRHDEFHAAIYFSTAAGIALALPWERRRPLLALASVAIVAVVALRADPGPLLRDTNPIDRLDLLRAGVRVLFSPGERRELSAYSRRTMIDNAYRIDPETLSLVRGHPVHIDPWEAGVAWAYRLDWRPLPVFQDYLAYTAPLDELNARALSSSTGPERILRENTDIVEPAYPGETLDERSPSLDPPAATVSMLCNFEPLRTTRRWQVLARLPNRCSGRRPAGEVETSYGETVPVPRAAPRELVIAVVEGAEVGGLERLRALLYKPAERRISFGGKRSYRLVPGTSRDGLLLDAGAGADFPAPFAFSPRARSLTITKGDATDPLSIRFYRVTVAGATPPHRRSG